jgi:hypothetical protein
VHTIERVSELRERTTERHIVHEPAPALKETIAERVERPAPVAAPAAARSPEAPVIQPVRRRDPAPAAQPPDPRGILNPVVPRAPIPAITAVAPRMQRAAGALVAEKGASPVINVTIGRVEVRGAAAPVPRTPARPRATPRLNLEDYLAARARGTR